MLKLVAAKLSLTAALLTQVRKTSQEMGANLDHFYLPGTVLVASCCVPALPDPNDGRIYHSCMPDSTDLTSRQEDSAVIEVQAKAHEEAMAGLIKAGYTKPVKTGDRLLNAG